MVDKKRSAEEARSHRNISPCVWMSGGPVKPENVSCVIPQPSHESVFLDSGILSCHWDWSSSDPANFTLNVLVQ